MRSLRTFSRESVALPAFAGLLVADFLRSTVDRDLPLVLAVFLADACSVKLGGVDKSLNIRVLAWALLIRALLRPRLALVVVVARLPPLDFFLTDARPFRNEEERDVLVLRTLRFAGRLVVPRPPVRDEAAARAVGARCCLAERTKAVTNWSLRIECQPETPICLANSPSSLTVCVFRSAAVIKEPTLLQT